MHATGQAHLSLLDLRGLIILRDDRAIAEAVSRWLPTAAARVRARVWQVGFVVDKVASEQVFSKYFGFHAKTLNSTNFSIIITITRGS
jgi:hypothetical protein